MILKLVNFLLRDQYHHYHSISNSQLKKSDKTHKRVTASHISLHNFNYEFPNRNTNKLRVGGRRFL